MLLTRNRNWKMTGAPAVGFGDLLAALEPILDWYQSDEHPPRNPLDIVRDVVSDLQQDRKAALVLASAKRDTVQLCYEIENLSASEQQTKCSLMAANLRQKLSEANR